MLEMTRLLVIHVLHQRSQVRMCLHDRWYLCIVNPYCCQFSSVIDSELLKVRPLICHILSTNLQHCRESVLALWSEVVYACPAPDLET